MNELCTSRVVYAGNSKVHAVYMAKGTRKTKGRGRTGKAARGESLRWRKTKMPLWRKDSGMTQQDVADRLGEKFPEFVYTRESIQRIESGNQMPGIGVIEALAELFGTDVDSMLNFTPEEAAIRATLKQMDIEEVERVLRIYRAVTTTSSATDRA